jgi:hypothetical protein
MKFDNPRERQGWKQRFLNLDYAQKRIVRENETIGFEIRHRSRQS